MAKLYQYTLFHQNGDREVFAPCPKKKFDGEGGLYEMLDCETIQIIPSDYYKGRGYGRVTMFTDENGRFRSDKQNVRNPHFNVLESAACPGDEWDIVGDVVMEQVYHG